MMGLDLSPLWISINTSFLATLITFFIRDYSILLDGKL